jgi:anti-anti-sigma factor
MRNNPVQDAHYIRLSGEYDIARKSEIAAAFDGLTNGAPVTIDMTDVSYVDSSFLNELMRLRLKELPVTLIGAQPNILRVLQLTKLDRLFILQ